MIFGLAIKATIHMISLLSIRPLVSSFAHHRRSMLSTATATKAAISKAIIIGGGRIGNHLYESNDKKDILLKRNDIFPTTENGPIYVCVRNDDLENLIESIPESRRSDLVFVQNSVLAPILQKFRIEKSCTQALIYYGITKKGDAPVDGKTDVNPEGLTAVTGKWSHDFAQRLAQAGLTCHIHDYPTWQVAMFEKHIWICAFMLIGVKHKITVGEVEKYHREEVNTLVEELASLITKEYPHIVFSANLTEKLCGYARAVAHYPTAIKEYHWRNGWFVELAKKHALSSSSQLCPSHAKLLQDIGIETV